MIERHGIIAMVFALLITLVSSKARAESWREPDDFRGVKWGWTIEEVKKNQPQLDIFKYGLHDTLGPRIKIYWTTRQIIGDMVVDVIRYGFLDGRFAYGELDFKSGDFDSMRNAFFERYGRPHNVEQIKLRNRINAEFLNIKYAWNGPTLGILLQKYTDTVTYGRGQLAKGDFINEMPRGSAQKSKDAAKGL